MAMGILPSGYDDVASWRLGQRFHSLAAPDGVKVTVMLEELLALGRREAEYDAWLIQIGEGDRFGSGFVELNPNSKIPALLDTSVEPVQRVFESGAILLYLAEKFGAFLPEGLGERAECLSRLFWQVGSAPYLGGGGFGRFYAYASCKMRYPVDRFAMEVKRQLDVLEKRLVEHPHVAGNACSIADMAICPGTATLLRASSTAPESCSRFRNTCMSAGGMMRSCRGRR